MANESKMKYWLRNIGLGLASLVALSAQGQKVDMNLLKGMKMRNVGPAGMSGRITSIDVVHSQPDIIYAGSASGGLWKSESGGINWHPIFDDQPVQSIGAVAVCQSNPSIVWAGTGEGNPRNSLNAGEGIYRSLDAGKTWQCMGLEKTKTIHRIIIHRDNPEIVWVAALGSPWGTNSERGVFKTTNGGQNWEKVLYVNDSTGCADLIIDPSNPNKLIAAMWQHGRSPWFFRSGGKGSGLYITYDGGKTWKRKTDADGLPKGELGRMGLTLCHSQPKVVYALIEAKETGLYRSDDGGETWKLRATENIGNRPFYYADIYCDPINENRIYNLFSIVSMSEDGGKTFQTLVSWNDVHPDHHAFFVHPQNPQFLIDGNDGGMAISRDRGRTWQFVENLPLGQFYHINVDQAVPYNLYGGMQDNGSWIGPGFVWKNGGIRNEEWQEMVFGDGFDVMPDPTDNRFGYAMYQGGNLYRYDLETGEIHFIQPNHPEGKPLRFNWNAGMAQDPHNPKGLYFGSQYLHYSPDQGATWEVLSPDLTTNNPDKQKQSESGGLTIDATRAENHTTILCIAPSHQNPELIWVGTDDGNLQLTTDRGKTWNNLYSKLPGAPANGWVAQVEVSKHNANEAFVVVNNYRQNDWKPYFFHTTDKGASFTRIAKESEVDGHALCLVQDPVEPNLLFLGTDHGLWMSLDHGKTWNAWRKGFPAVTTQDLKVQEEFGDLIIGTFGRAAWVLDDLRPLRALAKEGKGLLQRDFKVFEAPAAYLSKSKEGPGIHFPGDGGFRGANRPRGAMLSFWVKDPSPAEEKKAEKGGEEAEKDEKAAEKAELAKKVQIWVIGSSRDTVRYFTVNPDTGLNRISWSLRADGQRGPTFDKVKEKAVQPEGNEVLAGTYKVVMQFKGLKDSLNLEVKSDPRITYNPAKEQRRQAWISEFMAIKRAAFESFERLKAAQENIAKVEGVTEYLTHEKQTELKKAGADTRKAIKALQELYMLDPEFNGYNHVTPFLTDWLERAEEYIGSAAEVPSPNAQLALEKAKKETDAVVTRVNAFLKTEWAAYQQKVQAIQPGWFGELAPVEMK